MIFIASLALGWAKYHGQDKPFIFLDDDIKKNRYTVYLDLTLVDVASVRLLEPVPLLH